MVYSVYRSLCSLASKKNIQFCVIFRFRATCEPHAIVISSNFFLCLEPFSRFSLECEEYAFSCFGGFTFSSVVVFVGREIRIELLFFALYSEDFRICSIATIAKPVSISTAIKT